MKPGMVANAASWPPWEEDGAKSPHPILIAASYLNGNVLVLPISHSWDLCVIGIKLDDKTLPTAYAPGGPLTMRDSFSVLFLKEKAGRQVVNSGGVGSPEPGAIRFGQWGRLILTSQPVALSIAEWHPLQAHIRKRLGLPG